MIADTACLPLNCCTFKSSACLPGGWSSFAPQESIALQQPAQNHPDCQQDQNQQRAGHGQGPEQKPDFNHGRVLENERGHNYQEQQRQDISK
jgi:hypothetical protein